MYWILMSERSNKNELSIDILPPFFDSLNISFDYGNIINTAIPVIDIHFSNTNKSVMTDNLVAPPRTGLLINAKVKEIFDTLKIDNIQYFKSRLIDENTKAINSDYCLANIMGKISCVDKSQSELELFPDGDIRFIDKLVLNLNDTINYGHIFRLAEYSTLLLISNELKIALSANNVTGFQMYKPENFSL